MGSERSWQPGDPDRRRANRSLLEATGTTADEHRPAAADVRAHGEWVVAPLADAVPPRSPWRRIVRRLTG